MTTLLSGSRSSLIVLAVDVILRGVAASDAVRLRFEPALVGEVIL